MDLPFTVEQFFSVFARYNEAVWPMQIVLNAAALACVALLFAPRAWASRAINVVLAVFWAWMALAYQFAFFTAINPAAWVFGGVFLLSSLAFAWLGAVREAVPLRPMLGARGIAGAALIVFALVVYPILGHLNGHRYPSAPTFGLPCPTTIFTLGMLLFSVHRVSRWVFVVPLAWVAVGSVAVFQLGVLEDLGLLAAGVATIALLLLSPAPAGRPLGIK